MNVLSEEEVARYARQIVLYGIGGPGQQKLKAAKALMIGAGGLGCAALPYLVAAGVGQVTIVDDDRVSLSNLQRQILYGTEDIGRAKAECAQAALSRLNPHVNIVALPTRFEESCVRGHDIVLDGSDNFATRYCVAEACAQQAVPLVTGALGAFSAMLTTLKPFARDVEGRPYPSYRDLFPQMPDSAPTCAEVGVLGALAGMVGAMMACETMREIVGGFAIEDIGLVGKLLVIDALRLRFETIVYKNP